MLLFSCSLPAIVDDFGTAYPFANEVEEEEEVKGNEIAQLATNLQSLTKKECRLR